jgi:hypothetical protein
MDYITDMSKNQRLELQNRLAQYETSILLLSHNGDVPTITGFNVVRVSTMMDLIKVELPAVAVLGDEAQDLAYIIGARPLAIGANVIRIVDVPGQVPSVLVNAELGALHEVSMVRVLNDIADEALVKANMTETELAQSATKRQEAQRQRSDGTVRPLVDFDHGDIADAEE